MAKKNSGVDKEKVLRILDILEQTYPEADCELNFNNPFQLLIATILSAQATDKKVNEITAKLFKKYQTPNDFLQLSQAELEKEIREIGLYRNKSKNILATCQALVEKHQGIVPQKIEDLILLPGVGRKTANVVGSVAFKIPAIAVDTHVFRVANRLGLANSNQVKDVEEQLMNRIPMNYWIRTHHWLIWHGRRICKARKPECPSCPLQFQCEYYIDQNSSN